MKNKTTKSKIIQDFEALRAYNFTITSSLPKELDKKLTALTIGFKKFENDISFLDSISITTLYIELANDDKDSINKIMKYMQKNSENFEITINLLNGKLETVTKYVVVRCSLDNIKLSDCSYLKSDNNIITSIKITGKLEL